MNNKCEKCGELFSSKRSLNKHLAKKYPCDNKCRQCDYVTTSTRQLNKHIKAEHPETEIPAVKAALARNQEIIELQPKERELPDRFPLDDYKWEALAQTVEEKTFQKTTQVGNKTKVVEKFTVRYERYVLERTETLCEDMKTQSKLQSLQALNHDYNIEHVMTQLLYNVNAQPDKPRHHAICKTASDGTIATFNRVHETDDCLWVKHNPSDAQSVVNEHGKRLLSFALQAGILLLKMAFWMKKKQVVLHAHESYPDGKTYVIVVYFDQTIKELRCIRDDRIKLNEFVPCVECVEGEMDLLEQRVNERKQQVIDELERVVLSKHDVNLFLDFSQKHIPVPDTEA